MMLAGHEDIAAPARPRQPAAVRDVFSPSVRSDPWFLDRQREKVEALEAHCRETGEIAPRRARRGGDFDELAEQ